MRFTDGTCIEIRYPEDPTIPPVVTKFRPDGTYVSGPLSNWNRPVDWSKTSRGKPRG